MNTRITLNLKSQASKKEAKAPFKADNFDLLLETFQWLPEKMKSMTL